MKARTVVTSLGSVAEVDGFSCLGNQNLLHRPGIGVCGSRNASDAGLEYAGLLGELAYEAGLVVVSGYAGGVDQHAHIGALRSGGATIAVLAEGLARFSLRVSMRDWVTSENLLVVSEFDSEAGWATWRAMQRNKTIIAMSLAMFVVEAGETGGTFDAGMETLRRGVPLFVLNYKNDRPTTKGNKLLVSRGGVPITTVRSLKSALSKVKSGTVEPRKMF